jgi:hypothetical protein
MLTSSLSLGRLAKELRITKHVSFYNRFVELEELTDFIGAADLYISPYSNAQQAVSGMLAYAFGCGPAVISTPDWHADGPVGTMRSTVPRMDRWSYRNC